LDKNIKPDFTLLTDSQAAKRRKQLRKDQEKLMKKAE
jgi:hypothetical protein